jgi:hypothetical protein
MWTIHIPEQAWSVKYEAWAAGMSCFMVVRFYAGPMIVVVLRYADLVDFDVIKTG